MPPIFGGCLGSILCGIFLLYGCSMDDDAAIWVGVIGIFASMILGLIFDNKMTRKIKNDLENQINKIVSGIKDFTPTQYFLGEDRESYIAIDEERKKILFINNKIENVVELSNLNKYDFDYKIFDYRDILQVSILKDGVSVTRTSRTSQLGGALLGGILAGGVGAAIGGLSGSKTTQNEFKKVQLQVVVNDPKKTFYRITFALFETNMTENSISYKSKEKILTHWYNLLSYVIKVADEDDKYVGNEQSAVTKDITEIKENKFASASVADELAKLAQLYKDGFITEEEFNKQKQKILSQ